MKLILKKAKIIDSAWKKEKKRFDIAIRNGEIEKIASKIDLPGYTEINTKNLNVCAGFLDIGTQIGEPGLEHREDITSISRAAARGGFTAIAPFPNNNPTTHSKSEVLFIINNSEKSAISFYPIGAVSRSSKGEDITEFIDMKRNGAVAFSDGKNSIYNSNLMLRALQYAKACDALIINHPDEGDLSKNGQIHEGKVSVSLGLEGLPEMAETLGLSRDLQLANYTDGKYCAFNISTAESSKILKGRPNALSTVSYLNLLFEDKDVQTFNSNLKVHPPLRSAKDRKALIKAINNDTITAITSAHTPLEEELKKKSFAFAEFGAIGIETIFPALLTSLSENIALEKIVEKLSEGPRNILGLPKTEIKEGVHADLCIFDPTLKWTYEKVFSKSRNTPFLGQEFTGKVLGIINNGQFIKQ